MLTLHPFQLDVCRRAWRELYVAGKSSCLLQAPTGSGKTVMAAFLLRQMVDHLPEFSCAAFAHRREIVQQTAKKLSVQGVWPGIVMSGDVLSPSRPVQVCSIDSYAAWCKSGKIRPLHPSAVIIDEAHRSMSPTYTRVIADMMQAGAKLLGLTATPIRSDKKGLGEMYETMICAPGVAELQAMGFLCPVHYKVGVVPDVSGVKLTAGDYDAFELQAVLDQKMLIGSVVENWVKFAKGRPTMGFATGVAHSMHLVDSFKALGIKAVHIDGDTPTKTRDDAGADLARGNIDIIFNANVYIEGTDIPAVSCIIDAQPTKHVGRYLQKGGRGLRTCEGKQDCLYMDHANNLYEHGRLEMHREWTLCTGTEQVEAFALERAKSRAERVCAICGTSFTGMVCPACGDEYVRKGKEVDYLPAELADMTHEQVAKIPTAPSPAEKKRWFQEALSFARSTGRKEGWAAHCYESKWKEGMPPREWMTLPSRKTTEAVADYMTRQIKRHAIIVTARKLKAAGRPV